MDTVEDFKRCAVCDRVYNIGVSDAEAYQYYCSKECEECFYDHPAL